MYFYDSCDDLVKPKVNDSWSRNWSELIDLGMKRIGEMSSVDDYKKLYMAALPSTLTDDNDTIISHMNGVLEKVSPSLFTPPSYSSSGKPDPRDYIVAGFKALKYLKLSPNLSYDYARDVFVKLTSKEALHPGETLKAAQYIESEIKSFQKVNYMLSADGATGILNTSYDYAGALELTQEGIEQIQKNIKSNSNLDKFKPAKIKEYLDQFVTGQHEAKRILAVAAWNHMLRNNLRHNTDEGKLLKKTNAILVGPTGCGKTYLCECLARYLSLPLHIGDATELTPDGYVGADCADLISKLYENANQDKAKAECGIIVIDEVDKLASVGAQSEAQRNNKKNYAIGGSIKGMGVQQALLKMVEGKLVSNNQGNNPAFMQTKAPMPEIDTSGIMFIISGAFSGITANNFSGSITTDDLVGYGLMPEFVGRFPLIATLTPLDKESLAEIIWKPKGSLVNEYKAMFGAMEKELLFTQSAIQMIAGKALIKGTGARGLRGVIENALFNLMYDAPDSEAKTFVVTEDVIKGVGVPLVDPEIRGESWI